MRYESTPVIVALAVSLFTGGGCVTALKHPHRDSNYNVVIDRSAAGEPRGTVLLIHGSAPFNEDGIVPAGMDSPYSKVRFYKDLARALSDRGWDVARYAKPGVGSESVDFDVYKTTDVKRISEQLNCVWQRLPEGRKVIFAWSEGSLHAALLPLKEASAVVLLGGIGTNIGKVIRWQAGRSGDPTEVDRLLASLPSMPRDEMLGIDRPVGRLLDELAMPENWTAFRETPDVPLLILHGSSDTEVPPEEALIWAKNLGGHDVTTRVIQGRNHALGFRKEMDIEFLATAMGSWLDARFPNGGRTLR